MIGIVGSSGHAKVVIDILERRPEYRIAGLFDLPRLVGKEVLGYPILGSEEQLPQYRQSQELDGVIVAIGDNDLRRKVVESIERLCPVLPFVRAIHPSVQLGKAVSVGPGSVLIAGAVVNAAAKVGAHCIVNTKASLGHDAVMQDFSSLASGATVGGGALMGTGCAIALSATVLHNRKVGAHTVVGAGAVVSRDLPDAVVAYGIPCRVIRTRSIGEKYY